MLANHGQFTHWYDAGSATWPFDQDATVALRDNIPVGALDGATADMVDSLARCEAVGGEEGFDEKDDAHGNSLETQSPFRERNDDGALAASAHPLPLAILQFSD